MTTVSTTARHAILPLIFVLLGVGTLLAAPAQAQRVSVMDLQAQIDALETQLATLQVQVSSLPAPNSIDGSHVINESLTGSDIATGSITGSDIALNTVASVHITNGSITSTDIAVNTITGGNIATSTITGSDIASSTIFDVDMGDEAGVEFASGGQSVILTNTETSIRALTLTAPTSGYVIVMASGYFDLNSTGTDTPRCSITNGAIAIDFDHLVIASDSLIPAHQGWIPFATNRVYVVSAGSTVYRLVCDISGSGSADVEDTSLTAIFVPTRY